MRYTELRRLNAQFEMSILASIERIEIVIGERRKELPDSKDKIITHVE
jgi:hypothetical protein